MAATSLKRSRTARRMSCPSWGFGKEEQTTVSLVLGGHSHDMYLNLDEVGRREFVLGYR